MNRKTLAFLFLVVWLFLFTKYPIYAKEIKILEGHKSPISDFVVNNQKNTLVSLDSEGKVKFWSLDSYKVVKDFSIYNAPYFTHIDTSFTTRYIALSGDEVLWVFDTTKGKTILKISGVESRGLFIGGERLLYLRDGYINILDFKKVKLVPDKIEFPYPSPNSIEISPSKEYISFCSENYLMIFDLKSRKIVRKIKGAIDGFSFLGDTKFLYNLDNIIFLSAIDGKPIPILHKEGIEYFSGSPSGKYLLLSTKDDISLYSVENYKLKKIKSREFAPIQKWAFISRDLSAFLVLGSNEITLVSVLDFSAVANLGGYSLPVDKLRFSHSGDFILAGFKDVDNYLFRLYDIRHHVFIENDLFSSCIDFETSRSSDKVALLDSNYDLYIYNLKKLKIEKVIPEVREELLFFRKNLVYTFFGYNNLGIYNIKAGEFSYINLNTMPFFSPWVSEDGRVATLGEDGNIWLYTPHKREVKKVELPDEVKEKLQAEEIGINIPIVIFTKKSKELILSVPFGDKFIVEEIENFKVKNRLEMEGPIIGIIDNDKYYLEEVSLSDTGKTVVNILNKNFKKMKTIEMGDTLISTYDYSNGFLMLGDYGGISKVVRLKDLSTITIRIFADGNWIILNDKGEFSAGEGIEKYLNIDKNEVSKYLKKDVMIDFFKM